MPVKLAFKFKAVRVAALIGLGVAGAVGATMAIYSTMNDGVISPTGGMVVSGPEGSIQLNKKDSIIAGTNLGGGGNNNGGNSSAEIRELKNMVAAIANRPISVQIDRREVAKATQEEEQVNYDTNPAKYHLIQ